MFSRRDVLKLAESVAALGAALKDAGETEDAARAYSFAIYLAGDLAPRVPATMMDAIGIILEAALARAQTQALEQSESAPASGVQAAAMKSEDKPS